MPHLQPLSQPDSKIPPYLQSILDKILTKRFTFADADSFMQFGDADDSHWEIFFENIAINFTSHNHPDRQLKFYAPGKAFPSISLSGNNCALDCEHCDKKYLNHMIAAETPDDLKETFSQLINRGAVGTLISGGCDAEGKVPLLNFEQTILDFKNGAEGKKFFLNSHVGLVSDEEAMRIKAMGIDTVSFDLNLDPKVIAELFHLPHTPQQYKDSFRALLKAKVRVIPHILIGANFGKIEEELDALRFLHEISTEFPGGYTPELIVFIVMIPPRTKGVMDSRFSLISPSEVAKLILIAQTLFPNSDLSLGCMRPHGSYSFAMEKWSIQAGAYRVVKPSSKTRRWAESQGYPQRFFAACCLIPSEFDPIAEASSLSGYPSQ